MQYTEDDMSILVHSHFMVVDLIGMRVKTYSATTEFHTYYDVPSRSRAGRRQEHADAHITRQQPVRAHCPVPPSSSVDAWHIQVPSIARTGTAAASRLILRLSRSVGRSLVGQLGAAPPYVSQLMHVVALVPTQMRCILRVRVGLGLPIFLTSAADLGLVRHELGEYLP